jgi:hypothetical protein
MLQNRPEYAVVVYIMKLHEDAYTADETIEIYGAKYAIPKF